MNKNETSHPALLAAGINYGLSGALERLKEAIYSSITPQFVISLNPFEELLRQLTTISGSSMCDMIFKSMDIPRITSLFDNLVNDLVKTSFSTLDFSVFKDITIDTDCVTIPDEAIEPLTNLLDEHDEEQPHNLSNKISTKEFILQILLPLMTIILSMMQTAYYHKLDTLESQKNQMQVAEYQEQMLTLENEYKSEIEELNNNLDELLQYLELSSSPETSLPDSLNTEPTPVEPLSICEVSGNNLSHQENAKSSD